MVEGFPVGLRGDSALGGEDVGCGGLGEEEQDKGYGREPHGHPDHPTPALETGRETSEQQTKTRRACDENTPEGQPVCTLLQGV